jgi:hypothetical protein
MLAQILGLGWLACLTCAVIYPSSWVYLHFTVGHLSFLTFCYLPWAVIAVVRYSALSLAIIMVLAFFSGGCYMILKTGVLLSIISISLIWRAKSVQPIKTLLIGAALTILLATPKLIQIWPVQSRVEPNTGDHLRFLSEDVDAFFSRDQSIHDVPWSSGGDMGFHEAGAYLSPLFVPLIVIGAGANVWTIAAVTMVTLGIGDYFGSWSPSSLLGELPLFSWMRINPRWFIIAIFCFGVMAAYGADHLSKIPIGTIIVVVLLTEGLIDCWFVSTASLIQLR